MSCGGVKVRGDGQLSGRTQGGGGGGGARRVSRGLEKARRLLKGDTRTMLWLRALMVPEYVDFCQRDVSRNYGCRSNGRESRNAWDRGGVARELNGEGNPSFKR